MTSVPQTFNGAVEIGLRALVVLVAVYPSALPLERLTTYDYLVVHSEDVEGGPPSLHPPTPLRGGELMVRRGPLQAGIALYASRGLLEQRADASGFRYAATDDAGAFLDALSTTYVRKLRKSASWLIQAFEPMSDSELTAFVGTRLGTWGAEFDRAVGDEYA